MLFGITKQYQVVKIETPIAHIFVNNVLKNTTIQYKVKIRVEFAKLIDLFVSILTSELHQIVLIFDDCKSQFCSSNVPLSRH